MFLEDNLVTAHAFGLDYWPRLPSSLTKKHSPCIVFPEILGVIKGSMKSTRTLAPLRLDEYLELLFRIAPSYPSQEERSEVYNIYTFYEALKKSRREFDLVDRVVRLTKAIRENPNLERILTTSFHEIYVEGN